MLAVNFKVIEFGFHMGLKNKTKYLNRFLYLQNAWKRCTSNR